MKLKINKQTIETILWLLGQLITLIRNISKDNKDNEFGKEFDNVAEGFSNAKFNMLHLKKIKMEEDHEQKKNERNAQRD